VEPDSQPKSAAISKPVQGSLSNPNQSAKATISSTADSQARRKTERKRQLAETAQSLQQRLYNFSTSFVSTGGTGGGSLTNSNNSINETQKPKPSTSGVVHLSDLRGPLPESLGAKQREDSASSESTLTEANNDRGDASPSQLVEATGTDPIYNTVKSTLHKPHPITQVVSSRAYDRRLEKVAEPNPHSILAIYTNQVAEASATDAALKKLENDILDSQIDVILSKYGRGSKGAAGQTPITSILPLTLNLFMF
jgi:hypothetical protein